MSGLGFGPFDEQASAARGPADDSGVGDAPVPEEYHEHYLAPDLREMQAVYIVPPKSLVRGEMVLDGGAIIAGAFCGRMICSRGVVAILKGAVFEGEIEADQVWIDGDVRLVSAATANLIALASRSTPKQARGAMATLTGRFKGASLQEGDGSRIVGRQAISVSMSAMGQAVLVSTTHVINSSRFQARCISLQA